MSLHYHNLDWEEYENIHEGWTPTVRFIRGKYLTAQVVKKIHQKDDGKEGLEYGWLVEEAKTGKQQIVDDDTYKELKREERVIRILEETKKEWEKY